MENCKVLNTIDIYKKYSEIEDNLFDIIDRFKLLQYTLHCLTDLSNDDRSEDVDNIIFGFREVFDATLKDLETLHESL